MLSCLANKSGAQTTIAGYTPTHRHHAHAMLFGGEQQLDDQAIDHRRLKCRAGIGDPLFIQGQRIASGGTTYLIQQRRLHSGKTQAQRIVAEKTSWQAKAPHISTSG